MRFDDDFDEFNKSKSFTIAATISIAAIVLVVILVFASNPVSVKRKLGIADIEDKTTSVQQILDFSNITSTSTTSSYESSGLTVSDLDFYNLYPKESDEEEPSDFVEEEGMIHADEADEDFSVDGKHTLIKRYDGSEEWIAINPNLPKATYDYTCLYNQSGKMKYFEDNKCTSFFGVDISKEQDYIDFVKLKKAGVEFVMIRVGARGYQSGDLTTDDYFRDNLKRANDAGINVGLYFLSNAITEEEAVEEATYLVNGIGEYKVSFPIAFVMKYQKNDTSRIDALTKTQKTSVAKAFCSALKTVGYKSVIYGDKQWLIEEIDLPKVIGDFDLWFSQTDVDIPDFPYRYTMWQYNDKGTIDGISGVVDFDISFVDYSLK